MIKNLEKLGKLWQRRVTRKEFLKKCLAVGVGVGASMYLFDMASKYEAYAAIGEKRGMREALFYEKTGEGAVRCLLCPNQCTLSDGQRGFCRAREPLNGKLYTLVYELTCTTHIDPIEKKPLFHVRPGSKAFSIATAGCNSRCKFCQNWTISQKKPEEVNNRKLSCRDVVLNASGNGCDSIAYTYTEPTIFYEYMLRTSEIARENGILNVAVTGGKINPEPLKRLCRVLDAANVDLKAFNDKYLKDICAQRLKDILRTLVILKKEGVWVEITNLIVPTLNDNFGDIRQMARWIRNNLGPDVPLHFSKFWPQYKLRTLYPTPIETLNRAREIALEEGLRYVYMGNVPDTAAETTTCPGCGKTLIKRTGYIVRENNVSGGACKFCKQRIAGIWP